MISKSGKSFEERVNLICGSTKPAEKIADGIFEWKDQTICHEQKGKEKDKGSINTNQVRPIKYNVLVFQMTTEFRKKFDVPKDHDYLVMPPNVAVKIATERSGQHTVDAIMCTSLNISHKACDRVNYTPKYWTADDTSLKEMIINAHSCGEMDTRAKNFVRRRKALYDVIVAENKDFIG